MSLERDLKRSQKDWEILGKKDPLWGVVTDNSKLRSWEKHLEEFFLLGQIEIKTIMEYLKKKEVSFNQQKALDFGCGVGRLTRFLCETFDSVIGCDVSQPMLKKAKELNYDLKNANFYLNTKPDLSDFESNSFDFIYSSLVLMHLSPRLSLNYIKEFIRLLSPNGITVFQIPNRYPKLINWIPIPYFIRRKRFEMRFGIKSYIELHYIPKRKIVDIIRSNNARLIEFKPKIFIGDKIVLRGIYIVKAD